MTYQSAINTFFLARFPAALMCLIVTPFWAKADDMDTTIFISLLILSSIAILWLFFRLPKKVLKYKGYSNHQIQRIDQYFDKLQMEMGSKQLIYFMIVLIILLALKILVLDKLMAQPLDMQEVIPMLAAISVRMLADYHHLKTTHKTQKIYSGCLKYFFNSNFINRKNLLCLNTFIPCCA
ncbi:hypothetical protein [Kingella kingae]|uniref:hypothetical protein n=3 Tax=Kingella kingae TaxID=504 RepID=UPI000A800568|nr:hypothetical protein [Kingella kingae]